MVAGEPGSPREAAARCWQWRDGHLLLRLRVQARAGRSGLSGHRDGALKVRVSAPPVAGAANKAVVALLADALGVPKGRIALVSGQGSRDKRVAIDVDQQRAAQLGQLIDELAVGE